MKALQIFPHPKYNDNKHYYDVALILLENPIEYTDFVRPLCLPIKSNTDLDARKGAGTELVGYGQNSAWEKTNGILKIVKLNIFGKSYCNKKYDVYDDDAHHNGFAIRHVKEKLPNLFKSNVMCAGDVNGLVGSCFGDSGGPLMYFDSSKSRYVQLGISSGNIGGEGCASHRYPDIFTRVEDPEVFAFIKTTLNTPIENLVSRKYPI